MRRVVLSPADALEQEANANAIRKAEASPTRVFTG